MTREEYAELVKYLEACKSPSNKVDGAYEVKLADAELEAIISALEEIIHW